MNQKLLITLALVAGFAGGLLSSFLAPALVHAQTQAPKEVRAQSFVLVDPDDNVLGTISNEPTGFNTRVNGRVVANPMIKLLDGKGRELWRAGGNPVRPLSQ